MNRVPDRGLYAVLGQLAHITWVSCRVRPWRQRRRGRALTIRFCTEQML